MQSRAGPRQAGARARHAMGSGGIDLSATTTNEVLYIGFNQDQSCFAVGTTTGFKVFNCSPFKEVRCPPSAAPGRAAVPASMCVCGGGVHAAAPLGGRSERLHCFPVAPLHLSPCVRALLAALACDTRALRTCMHACPCPGSALLQARCGAGMDLDEQLSHALPARQTRPRRRGASSDNQSRARWRGNSFRRDAIPLQYFCARRCCFSPSRPPASVRSLLVWA